MATQGEDEKNGPDVYKDGHIDVAHPIAKQWAKYRLSGEEWQVLWVIMEKTWGWHKPWDKISLKQFYEATAMKKPSIIRAIKKLVSKKIVSKKANKKASSYHINSHFNKWKSVSKRANVSNKANGVSNKANFQSLKARTSQSSSVPKETLTKEETKKDIKERTMMWSQIENLLSQFPLEIQDMIKEYIELAKLENKTKRITLQKRRRLINELHLLWTSCNSSITQKDFEKALRTTINNEAPNINYVRKVMKGIMRKRSVRLKRGRNGHT